MGDIINGVASEYEMPREPKFYPDDSKLPITNCNIPMPNVKSPTSNGDRICDTCNKEDVCMYKGELAQASKDITQISERVNVFIDTDIRMCYWGDGTAGKILKDDEYYSAEYKIKINNDEKREEIIRVLSTFDWKEYLNCIAMRKIQQFHIVDVLKQNVDGIK